MNKPTCSYCERLIKWDWCQDTFQISREDGEWQFGTTQELGVSCETTVHYCLCGEVLSVTECQDGGVLDVGAPHNFAWDDWADRDC